MPDNLLAKALFAELLQELTFNSKDVINKLTVFAGSNKSAANDIHSLLTEKLRESPKELLLTHMYVIDSIVKNVGEPFKHMFQNTLVNDFITVFDESDDKMKMSLHKLRHTWNPYYSLIKLHELDQDLHTTRDKNWTVIPLPAHLSGDPTSIPRPPPTAGRARVAHKPTNLTRTVKREAPNIPVDSPPVVPPGMKPSSAILSSLKKESQTLSKEAQYKEKIARLEAELAAQKALKIKEEAAREAAASTRSRSESPVTNGHFSPTPGADQAASQISVMPIPTSSQSSSSTSKKDKKSKSKSSKADKKKDKKKDKKAKEKPTRESPTPVNMMVGGIPVAPGSVNDLRSQAIHERTARARYGTTEKTAKPKETPTNLKSPNFELIFSEHLFGLLKNSVKPPTDQPGVKYHPPNKKTCNIKGATIPVLNLPPELENNQDAAYQYARDVFKQGRINKDGFNELLRMLKEMYSKKEKERLQEAALLREKLRQKNKRRGVMLADETLFDSDEKYYLDRKAKELEKKSKRNGSQDPLSVLGATGGDSSDDDAVDPLNMAANGKRSKIVKRQDQIRQNVFTSARNAPAQALPLSRTFKREPKVSGEVYPPPNVESYRSNTVVDATLPELPMPPSGIVEMKRDPDLPRKSADIAATLAKLVDLGVISGQNQTEQSAAAGDKRSAEATNGSAPEKVAKMDVEALSVLQQNALDSKKSTDKRSRLQQILTDKLMRDWSLETTDSFNKAVVKQSNDEKFLRKVMQQLNSGMICSETGIRFPHEQSDRYNRHLDWVYQRNQKDTSTSRDWCLPQGEWVTYRELPKELAKPKRPKKPTAPPKETIVLGSEEEEDDDLIEIVEGSTGVDLKTPKKKNKPGKLDLTKTENDDGVELFIPETPTPSKLREKISKESKEKLRKLSLTSNLSTENNEVPLDVLNSLPKDNQNCAISDEPFTTYYNETKESWFAKDCVIIDGKAYNTKNLNDKSILLDSDVAEESTGDGQPLNKKAKQELETEEERAERKRLEKEIRDELKGPCFPGEDKESRELRRKEREEERRKRREPIRVPSPEPTEVPAEEAVNKVPVDSDDGWSDDDDDGVVVTTGT